MTQEGWIPTPYSVLLGCGTGQGIMFGIEGLWVVKEGEAELG